MNAPFNRSFISGYISCLGCVGGLMKGCDSSSSVLFADISGLVVILIFIHPINLLWFMRFESASVFAVPNTLYPPIYKVPIG
jgi:hypothetical protein